MELKKYTKEEFDNVLDGFIEDNFIEFEPLTDFLEKCSDLKMALKFDAPILTIQLELIDGTEEENLSELDIKTKKGG